VAGPHLTACAFTLLRVNAVKQVRVPKLPGWREGMLGFLDALLFRQLLKFFLILDFSWKAHIGRVGLAYAPSPLVSFFAFSVMSAFIFCSFIFSISVFVALTLVFEFFQAREWSEGCAR
jgi:hypothetical protein